LKYSPEDYIKYRLERASESIKEARLLADKGHWNTTANRLYYAAFYSVNALLYFEGVKAQTHSGTKTEFHKLIKNELIDIKWGKLYSDLFNKRQEGDYQAFTKFKKADIEPLIDQVNEFIIIIDSIINKKAK